MTIVNEHQGDLYYALIETTMGWIGISGNRQGLRRLVLPEKTKEEALEKLSVSLQPGDQLIPLENQFTFLTEKIIGYFKGKPANFDREKVNLYGYTSFQQKVLLEARKIPYGETRTYQWLAEQAGHSRAYRAVGGVMSMNPLPLIIPCHRVISSQGKLGGFSATGGVALKEKMLELERCHDC